MTTPISKSQVFSFDGISFPVETYTTDFSNDIVQHKKPDRDGARLEATGRNPIVLQVRGLFDNGAVFDISPNTSDPLYPTVYKAFLQRCADGSTGDLVHPELGSLRAKAASFKGTVSAQRTGGAFVDVSFVEDAEDTGADLGVASPLSFATYSADALDAALDDLRVRAIELDLALKRQSIGSFADALRSVRGVADTLTLLQKQGGAIIPSIQHDLQLTKDSIDRLGDVTANTARMAAERMQAALFLVQQSLLVTKRVTLYTVKAATTLAALSVTLKTATTDLLRLNPALSNAFPPGVVQAATQVRYYGS